MSEKLNIEQLVSSKLANAEIAPSQASWQGIQRKLRWKQFMRFNPGQFNIYYLAGILLITTGLALVLSNRNAEPISPDQIDNSTKSIEETVKSEESSTSPPETAIKLEEESDSASKQEPAPISDSEIISEEKPIQDTEASLNELTPLEENQLKENEDEPLIPIVVPIDPIEEPVIENHSLPTLECFFISSKQSGCAPLEVQFTNKSVDASSYTWDFGTGDKSSASDPVYVFEEAGNYHVSLRIENKKGQSAIHQRTIEVYPAPKAEFDIEEGFEGIDGHVSLNLLNYSTGANTYAWNLLEEDNSEGNHWNSDEFQPALKLTDIKNGAKKIRLIAITENECKDTAVSDLPVLVVSSDVKIKFATAFSPNPTGPGDGTFSPHEKRIDLFHPIFLEVPVEYYLRVYTKRGELVFETRDAYQGWDGYFHEERSAGGVYIWMLEGTWLNGETFKKQGDVTLIWQDIW